MSSYAEGLTGAGEPVSLFQANEVGGERQYSCLCAGLALKVEEAYSFISQNWVAGDEARAIFLLFR